jgi:CheY-like chemotaxis protein
MSNAANAGERLSGRDSSRPLVLLVVDDDELSAKFAYTLEASGFDVVMPEDEAPVRTRAGRPDVIVAALFTRSGAGGLSARVVSSDPGARGVPVVAVAANVSDGTRELARREGCAAVCLTTCSGAALAMGLRAVLDHTAGRFAASDQLGRPARSVSP